MRFGKGACMVVAVLSLVAAAQTAVFGSYTPVAAPEIDPSALSTGFALVSAGALMLRARLRSR